MSETTIDLAAYFRRIGHEEPCPPSLDTLAALHLKHSLAIAFENLDPLLGRAVKLDLSSLKEKLVDSRRGGYCFEQNLLFMNVLRALGFRVSGLAARVLWNQPEGSITPRSHMLLRVELREGTYLADVGFGGLTLTAPLLLEPGLEQETPHETFRLERDSATWRMRARIGGEWRVLYAFQLEEQFQVDYEVSNHYVATHPTSHFIHSLIAARPTSEGRYSLLNKRLTFYDREGRASPRELASPEEIERVLRDIFDIELPDGEAFRLALRRESIL